MVEAQERSIDSASVQMIKKASEDGIETVFDRSDAMKPCPIGVEGSCCKICAMGPCRVPAPKKKVETEKERSDRKGLCGATAETTSS